MSALDHDDVAALYGTFARTSVALINEEPEAEFHPKIFAVWISGEGEDKALDQIVPMDPKMAHFFAMAPEGRAALEELAGTIFSGEHWPTEVMSVPSALVFVSEAWTLKVLVRDGDPPPGIDGTLADRPDRTQAIVTSIFLPGRCLIGMCPIQGEGASRRATFKPLDPIAAVFLRPSTEVH